VMASAGPLKRCTLWLESSPAIAADTGSGSAGSGLWMVKRPGEAKSMGSSSGFGCGAAAPPSSSCMASPRAAASALAVPAHLHVRNAGVDELLADDPEAVPLVEGRGLNLGAECLLAEIPAFGLGDHRFQQRIADAQAAPVAQHREAGDVAVGREPGGADRIVAVE